MNTNSQHREALIDEALRRHDSGEDLTLFFSEHTDIERETRELFALQERISTVAYAIDVPRSGLERALRETKKTPTSASVVSPLGAASLIPLILRFGVPAAALAVVALMVVTTNTQPGQLETFDMNSATEQSFKGAAETAPATESMTMVSAKSMEPLPPATGSVEDLRHALIQGAQADKQAVSEDDQDYSYATADEGVLTSLMQPYESNL